MRFLLALLLTAATASAAVGTYPLYYTNHFTTNGYIVKSKPLVSAGEMVTTSTNDSLVEVSIDESELTNFVTNITLAEPVGVILPGTNIAFTYDGTNTTIDGTLDGRALTNADTRNLSFLNSLTLGPDSTFLCQPPAYFLSQTYFGWGFEIYFDPGGSLLGSWDGSFTIGSSGANRPESVFARSLLMASNVVAEAGFYGDLAAATNLPVTGLQTNGATTDKVIGFDGSGIAWVDKTSLEGAIDAATATNISETVVQSYTNLFQLDLGYTPQPANEMLTNLSDVAYYNLTNWGQIPTAAKADAFYWHHLTNWINVPTNVMWDVVLPRVSTNGAVIGYKLGFDGSSAVWEPDLTGTPGAGIDAYTATNIARYLDQFPTNAAWILGKQTGSANLTNWSALATSAKQNSAAQLTEWATIWSSNKQDKLTYTPQPASANLTNWSALATSAKQDTFTAQVPGSVFAGPSSGSASSLPAFRPLVEDDLPLQIPSSRLYGLLPNAVLPGTLYYWSLIGTAAKQDTFTAQSAKVFYAGPTSGSVATPTFRQIAQGDLFPALNSVAITNASIKNTAAGEYGLTLYDLANASGSAGLVFDAGTPSATSTKFTLNGTGANLMNGAVINGGTAQTASRVAVWDASTNLTSSTVTTAQLEAATTGRKTTRSVSTSGNVLTTDEVIFVTAAGVELTLPTAVGVAGKVYTFILLNEADSTSLIYPSGGQTIDAGTQTSTEWLNPQSVISDGSNWYTY